MYQFKRLYEDGMDHLAGGYAQEIERRVDKYMNVDQENEELKRENMELHDYVDELQQKLDEAEVQQKFEEAEWQQKLQEAEWQAGINATLYRRCITLLETLLRETDQSFRYGKNAAQTNCKVNTMIREFLDDRHKQAGPAAEEMRSLREARKSEPDGDDAPEGKANTKPSDFILRGMSYESSNAPKNWGFK